MTDYAISALITQIAEQEGLAIGRRSHGGNFCTVYLEAPFTLPRSEQRSRLAQAKALLEANGVGGVTLTHFDNPPYRSKSTGKMETGHPRHGDPLLIIESVWWE